ncbi:MULTISPECIES: cytochrome-c oxidase, cbb3-type subunit II [unclassified Microbulbifer]|uniref:Cytochrome-c oxidase, cbb3-type subunit II n=1 Tax=Microbulbifer spongiae TaxID=2944933 RepID=A0ABY9EBU0_9GAMM|nr:MULTISPECIES: cytochrome-c oxidase, cbb3-type subunit II [unclassified Microbulbifer]MDP5210397.1 cytochrome-c oxidase, cbb3-type subunit II [Microbulbifer sp. 2205BS26-8]WKD50488.1 cytochrome-c oxidase, cbb3-type subunit II [Microbulbifer sp. MI-G]
MKNHDIVEKNIGWMILFIIIAISFGGLVEIIPQFYTKANYTPLPGMKPLSAVELEGRDIYIREGCHVCHTQMVRPLRAEVERYGHYSMAQESVYEHPFLWGSKRTGPDLARVGGRYSDEWQRAHLYNPRSVVPESIMPAYPWLFDNVVTGEYAARKMEALRLVGVPYTDEDIANASKPFAGGKVKEIDALVAYLQQLGTLVTQKR